MSKTVTYLLVGGGALVVTLVVAQKMRAKQEAASKPSGLAGIVSGVKTIKDNLGGFSYRTAPTQSLDKGGLPYGPTIGDGYVAQSDATGHRALRALVPAQTAYLTSEQQALIGIH